MELRTRKEDMAMEFKSKKNKDNVLIRIQGRILSMHDAQPLLDEVEEKISEGNQFFILDLSHTEYINSEGLNVLLKILTKTRTVGGETILCQPSEELEKLFIITKLVHIFNVLPSIEASEAFLKNKFGPVAV